jgi:hypothetical protein
MVTTFIIGCHLYVSIVACQDPQFFSLTTGRCWHFLSSSVCPSFSVGSLLLLFHLSQRYSKTGFEQQQKTNVDILTKPLCDLAAILGPLPKAA